MARPNNNINSTHHMNKKIYFAGSIRGGRGDASLYQRMIDYIKQTDTVLTEHIGKTNMSLKAQTKAIDIISMNEISNGSNKSTGNNSSNHSQMIYRPTETTYQKQLPTTSRLQPPPPPKKRRLVFSNLISGLNFLRMKRKRTHRTTSIS